MMLKKIESNLNRTDSCGDCTVENEKALRWFCYVVAVVKGWKTRVFFNVPFFLFVTMQIRHEKAYYIKFQIIYKL